MYYGIKTGFGGYGPIAERGAKIYDISLISRGKKLKIISHGITETNKTIEFSKEYRATNVT